MANEVDKPYKKARTPEMRVKQMMALAVNLSEQRLRDGTASSAEITFWLNLTSPKTQLEIQNLRLQGELLEAKKNSIISEQTGNQAYIDAMRALSGYQPTRDEIVDGEFYDIR